MDGEDVLAWRTGRYTFNKIGLPVYRNYSKTPNSVFHVSVLNCHQRRACRFAVIEAILVKFSAAWSRQLPMGPQSFRYIMLIRS